MNIQFRWCKNCGAEYHWQTSGTYNALITPMMYQDAEYCPECKKAIVRALHKIEKKTDVKYIKTDEITLEELQELEKQQYQLNPMCLVKCFESLYDTSICESKIIREVKYNHKVYIYSYYPSLIKDVIINKKVRFDIKTNEILTDEFYE